MKRARENALREKRELKQAKKDARAAARREGDENGDGIAAEPDSDSLPSEPGSLP